MGEGEPSLQIQQTAEVFMGLTWRKAEAAHSEALVQEEGSMAARSRGSRRLGALLGIQAAVVGVNSTVVGNRRDDRDEMN